MYQSMVDSFIFLCTNFHVLNQNDTFVGFKICCDKKSKVEATESSAT